MSKENINLPKTKFSMKANLPLKEPEFLEYWDKIGMIDRELYLYNRLSQLFSNGNESISLSPRNDFAVLCANCHRMIHRTDSPEDFEEFVKYYKKINKT